MKKLVLLLFVVSFIVSAQAQQVHNVRAPFDPAKEKVDEKKQGEILTFSLIDSQIYPGTEREILVYVPKQYKSKHPACLLVCMDGVLYDATTVMENLITSGEMPMTIGVFINPGVVYDENRDVVRYNRCKEFDSTDDTFAEFIEKEVLVKVEGMKTESGKTIMLSKDANDRAITGASSGGIAAFSVAWNRPDLFSRVYTSCGTFVAMRGGHEYPAVVRKTEPKPLRIYMQDGWYDVWNPIFGEWFEYNLLMESAFNFAGYELSHKWDRGNHNIKYGTLAFPDAMRWLWMGYPAKVQKGVSNNGMLQEILLDGEDWQEIELPVEVEGDLFASSDQSVIFASGTRIYQVSLQDNEFKTRRHSSLKSGERLVGDGLTMRDNQLFKDGELVTDSLEEVQAVCEMDRDRYLVLGTLRTIAREKVWVVNKGSRALAVAPDYRLCVTGEENTHHLISTIINQQGKMLYSEPFYYLHDLSNGTKRPSGNMAFDTKGNLYVATEMGVQVADHNGRVRAILSLPAGRVNSLAFSGRNLYVLCGNRMFVRKMNAEGYMPINGAMNYKLQGQG